MRTDIDTTPSASSADADGCARTEEELAEIADLQALLDCAFDGGIPGYDILALSRFMDR